MPNPFPIANLPIQEIAGFFPQLVELVTRLSEDATERQRIEAAREICIEEIENRYAIYRQVFDCIFAERRAVIDACFRLIDDGRTRGDRDMVLNGMTELGKLVQSSPFRDVEKLRAMLEGDEIIEI